MTSSFAGHQQTRNLCAELTQTGRFPHALLLHGMKSIGKFTFAKELASFLLSNERDFTHFPFLAPTHPVKILIEVGNHPDFLSLSAQDKTFDVQTVKEMIHRISLTPMKSNRIVVVIDELEHMNMQGHNAILKSLEEPPPHVYFISTSSALHAIPPTIVSRSWLLQMYPLTFEEIEGVLPATLDEQKKSDILNLSGGSPGIALRLLEIDFLDEFVSTINSILDGTLSVEFLSTAGIPDEIARYIVGLLIHRKAKKMFLAQPLASTNDRLKKAQGYLQDTLPPLQIPLLPSLRQALLCLVS